MFSLPYFLLIGDKHPFRSVQNLQGKQASSAKLHVIEKYRFYIVAELSEELIIKRFKPCLNVKLGYPIGSEGASACASLKDAALIRYNINLGEQLTTTMTFKLSRLNYSALKSFLVCC